MVIELHKLGLSAIPDLVPNPRSSEKPLTTRAKVPCVGLASRPKEQSKSALSAFICVRKV